MVYEGAKFSQEEYVAILKPQLQELMICLSLSWGGLEQVAVADALDRSALGLNVRFLCLEGSPVHEFLANKRDISVIPLDFRPRDLLDFRLRAELLKLLSEGVNLIHCHQPSLLGSISPWIWSRPDISLIVSRHIMSSHDKRDFVHKAIYSRVDSVVVMSQTLKQNVLATHPLRDRDVRVINLGLDFDRFDPDRVDPVKQRNHWGADADTMVIGLVGRIDPAKGQATFIRAAAGLIKSLHESIKVRFVMVGEETLGRASDHLGELKEMIGQFRLEEYIVFAGYQQNIPEVMSAFDILVMPSRQEAFGLVAIEAMAMECPIVISSGGSAEEIVGNEEYGLLTRPEDAFDLQRQLKILVLSAARRAEMGKSARAHVRAHYDRRTRIMQTLALYEWTLRKRSHF